MLLKLGEIVLKGGNRQQFERMLQANIRRALQETGVEIRLWQRDGVIVLRVAAADGNAAARGPAAEAAADKIAERVTRRHGHRAGVPGGAGGQGPGGGHRRRGRPAAGQGRARSPSGPAAATSASR